MSLKGKSALITGSTSGIGLAIARALAAEGVDVMLNGASGDGAPLALTIAKEFGVKAEFRRADLTQPEQVTKLVEEAEAALDGLDILVNNAGIQHVSPIETFPPEKWEMILRLNLIASFYSIRAALPGMKARGWGRIIQVSSVHALVASPFKSAYVAAKHGVTGLTKTVALEVAESGITVNAIAPGYVWTPLVEKQIPDTMKARKLTEEQVKRDVLLHAQSTKQFVTVEQVAAVAVFLASDAAAQITGTTLPVDGGWSSH